ncbi:LysM peptidoglycan-binding domain-containing protein [Brevirhabdus sp.]|uniref:LysM peptidoglycan-binding domain-containing protein n=1 Tax=Brevirhabdus sp. TaxID=2004514 RepID=UPI0040596030
MAFWSGFSRGGGTAAVTVLAAAIVFGGYLGFNLSGAQRPAAPDAGLLGGTRSGPGSGAVPDGPQDGASDREGAGAEGEAADAAGAARTARVGAGSSNGGPAPESDPGPAPGISRPVSGSDAPGQANGADAAQSPDQRASRGQFNNTVTLPDLPDPSAMTQAAPLAPPTGGAAQDAGGPGPSVAAGPGESSTDIAADRSAPSLPRQDETGQAASAARDRMAALPPPPDAAAPRVDHAARPQAAAGGASPEPAQGPRKATPDAETTPPASRSDGANADQADGARVGGAQTGTKQTGAEQAIRETASTAPTKTAPTKTAPTKTAPTPTAKPRASDVAALAPEAQAGGAAQTAAQAGRPQDLPDDPAITAPSIDVMRLDRAGAGLLAGRAEPGARIAATLDGTEIAETRSDSGGRFVMFLDVAPDTKPRQLSMSAETGMGRRTSDETILIAPFGKIATADAGGSGAGEDTPSAPPSTTPTAAPGTTTDGTTTDATSTDADPLASGTLTAMQTAPEAPQRASPELTNPEVSDPAAQTLSAANKPADQPADQPAAPALLLADRNGVRLIQPSADTAPEVMRNVVIDTISYDDSGEVQLAGRGKADRSVRFYLNNRPVRTTAIQVDGTWRTPLPQVQAGVYTLRVDELDGQGRVTSRFETPFQREDPRKLGPAALARHVDGRPGGVVTVQPGFTLWEIARANYGKGVLYVRVYEANKRQIRDPDLIYPGQVFDVPEAARDPAPDAAQARP